MGFGSGGPEMDSQNDPRGVDRGFVVGSRLIGRGWRSCLPRFDLREEQVVA